MLAQGDDGGPVTRTIINNLINTIYTIFLIEGDGNMESK